MEHSHGRYSSLMTLPPHVSGKNAPRRAPTCGPHAPRLVKPQSHLSVADGSYLYIMATLPLSLFLGGCIVAIPVVTGVAEGVEHQKKQNEEAANETRMTKFNALTSCDSNDEIADEVDNGILVVRHDKVRPLASFLATLRAHASTAPLEALC